MKAAKTKFDYRRDPDSYGGVLANTRKGRARPRPLSITHSMHLVLRSSKARGAWSFRQPGNQQRVQAITKRFLAKYKIQLLSMANVGNHLHFHLKLSALSSYKPFIRALTAAIAMAVTGASRWQPLAKHIGKFWDYRPFTRLVRTLQGRLRVQDYIALNELEGEGFARNSAKLIVGWRKMGWAPS